MKGKFITFEGCEGVGKSKQIKLLKEYLDKNKIEYFLTREPGGSKISEKIREIILDGNNMEITPCCEAMLYASARVQLLDEIIKPVLDSGKLVICDRYIDSSFAYQGYARGLGLDFIQKINSYAIENFTPNLTLFLDLSPKDAFLRKGGADKNDRLEGSGIKFHEDVYAGYLEIMKKYPQRIIDIDASGTVDQTHNKIINVLKEKGII